MPSIEKHYSFVCFLIDFYLRERFQEYTETNGVYCFQRWMPTLLSDGSWILMIPIELGVDKMCLLWFLHSCVGVGEERKKESEKEQKEKKEKGKRQHKGGLKTSENSHFLWPQACRNSECSRKGRFVGKGQWGAGYEQWRLLHMLLVDFFLLYIKSPSFY